MLNNLIMVAAITPGRVVLYVLLIIVAILILSNIKIVPQASEFIIERLGKYRATWSAGLHVTFPFIDRVARKITLKEQVLDSDPQPVITKDNVTMQIDTVVYFLIFDSKAYTYGVVNPINALENLTATTLRNIVGEMELDQTLSSRDNINSQMTMLLDEATDRWGIKVNRVELKNIMPPREIQNAMEKQMKAERERRETLLQAEGHKQAVITRAEGDKMAVILEAEGERDARIARAEGEAKAIKLAKEAEAEGIRLINEARPSAQAIELKRYEALVGMSNSSSAKIIVPTDVVNTARNDVLFSELTGLGDHTSPKAPISSAPKDDPCCDEPVK